ncbi:MAG: hypothetical protein GC168_12175 [Candidatus Hydrogenedens sp.]|nr:hypothetical protein [Candidatus Hydrogenedens sp.]
MEEKHQQILEAIGELASAPPEVVLPPAAALYGVQFYDFEEKKHIFARCPARTEWAGAGGEVHRETLAAAAGLCAEALAIALAKKRCALVSMEAQFFKSITADGRDMTLEARLKATRGSIAFCEVTAKCIDAKLSARFMYQYAVLKSPLGSGPVEEGDE